MMTMTASEQGDFFPFGTHYYCPPIPLPEEWEHDFEQLSTAGYTHVQFRALWRWYETRRGEFVWDDLDRIFDLAEQYGLRVVLKPMLENAPDYVFTAIDGTRIGFHGIPMTRYAMNSAYYAGGFMPCFDNPTVLAAAAVFLRLLAARYAEHPALWFYDAWNEPRSRPLAQCHCEHSVALFRDWLRTRFGPIEALNETLHKRWASYDGVIPPASNNDIVEMFFWRQWAAHAISEQVRFVVETIRGVDCKTPIAVHAGGCDVLRDPACDACDDMLNAQHTQRYGFSLNVSHWPNTPTQHHEAEYQASWLRRVDPWYWCHELYPNSADWCRSTLPTTLGRHVWMALAGGCSGLTFWEYRSVRMGIRSNGFGMREIDGSPTPRSRICDEIASALRANGTRLAQTQRIPARVGMLFSKETDLLLRLTKMRSWMGDLEHQTPDVDCWYKPSLRGAHVLYQANGEAVDFVLARDDLSSKRVLHVTCTEMIDADTADWLREFVRNGGVLVAEFPFACRDEITWIHPQRPGHELHELLGCRELTREETRLSPPDIAEFACGHRIVAKGWRIVLEPCGGDTIATWDDGAVAAVRNTYGAGVVYALGVNVSMSFANCWDDPGADVVRWLLRDAGLAAGERVPERQVWVRRRRGPDFEIWFVFNVSDSSKRIRLPAAPVAEWHRIASERVAEDVYELASGATLVVEMPIMDDCVGVWCE